MVRSVPIAADHSVTKVYKNRDIMILHAAFFLTQQDGHSAIQSDIMRYFHRNFRWTTNSNDVKEMLHEMVIDKWVLCHKHAKNTRVYELTSSGQEALQKTYELVKSDNILKTLKLFKNFPPDLPIGTFLGN